jgi:4-alpha-glucanotransferase
MLDGHSSPRTMIRSPFLSAPAPAPEPAPEPPGDIAAALDLLDKRRLVLSIHDACFPAAPGEDLGRGSPYTRGGLAFLGFARELGFDGVQLGPQGQTSRGNPSPYDGTLFSRNLLSLDPYALADDPAWAGLIGPGLLARIAAENPQPDGLRTAHAHAHDACHAVLADAYRAFVTRRAAGDPAVASLADALREFTARHAWLRADALYHALSAHHAGAHHRDWPAEDEARFDAVLMAPPPGMESLYQARLDELEQRFAEPMERYALGQLIVHRQHDAFRAAANAWGMRVYGDLQVGLSACDAWQRARVCLADYRMGAPPSRTNPEGQPWGYAVLDPDQVRDASGAPGPALAFFLARVEKSLDEFDGLRIDHPHGLVCPWVYRAGDPDPLHAVQHGARLFCSPHLSEHPGLLRHAIVRPEQLSPDPATPRYADDWVRDLDPDQVDRYAVLIDALVDTARARGAVADDLVCEVLSTQPYPLARVCARHGLGRFRVTQKANLDREDDVYRSENARPEDWIMVGNHDTAPIWRLARQWQESDMAGRQAQYLARRLRPDLHALDAAASAALARELAGDVRKLVHAKLADIFASAARHVQIFFADLLGMDDVYNAPGTVGEHNWSLRVPPDYATRHAAAAARGESLDLACVLALALRARGAAFAQAHASLLERLERRVTWWRLAR